MKSSLTIVLIALSIAARAADGFMAIPVAPNRIEFKFGHRGARGEFSPAKEVLFSSAQVYYRGDLLLDCAARWRTAGGCSHASVSMTWAYVAAREVIHVRVGGAEVIECRFAADDDGACSYSGIVLYVKPMRATNVLNPGEAVSMPAIRITE